MNSCSRNVAVGSRLRVVRRGKASGDDAGGLGNAQALFLAAGIRSKLAICLIGQPDLFEQLRCTATGLTLAQSAQCAEELKVMPAGEPPIKAAFVAGGHAHHLANLPRLVQVRAEDHAVAAARDDHGAEQLDQCGLAGAVGPQQTVQLAGAYLQRHVIHSNCGAVIAGFLAGTRCAQHLAPRTRCGKMLTQFLGVNCQNVHGCDYTMARQAVVISRRASIGCDEPARCGKARKGINHEH